MFTTAITRKPCRALIDGITTAMFGEGTPDYDLAVQQAEVPASVREHYLALGQTASACVGCRSCESRCPFGVPVAGRMQKTAELFGA